MNILLSLSKLIYFYEQSMKANKFEREQLNLFLNREDTYKLVLKDFNLFTSFIIKYLLS